MVLHKKILVAGFLLLFFALVQADYASELQQSCLDKNPISREIWRWEITEFQPANLIGGSVSSAIIGINNGVYTYGNCIQIDCVQDSAITESIAGVCLNKKLVSDFYNISYIFPECKPIYSAQSILSQNALCESCGDSKILSEYKEAFCSNGKKVLQRQITKYIDSTCQEKIETQTFFSNENCSNNQTSLLAIIFVIFIAGYWWFKW